MESLSLMTMKRLGSLQRTLKNSMELCRMKLLLLRHYSFASEAMVPKDYVVLRVGLVMMKMMKILPRIDLNGDARSNGLRFEKHFTLSCDNHFRLVLKSKVAAIHLPVKLAKLWMHPRDRFLSIMSINTKA